MQHQSELPTPCIVVHGDIARNNIQRMAQYAADHGMSLRPHTKTHKSLRVAEMQLAAGAIGLTVAKAGEARVMAQVCDDILMAYPTVDDARCQQLAHLAHEKTIRVAIDSELAATQMSSAATSAGSTVGVLVDYDVGFGRTGVQSAAAALELAQKVDQLDGVRLDGLMIYTGHVVCSPEEQVAPLQDIEAQTSAVLDNFQLHGLSTQVVSGGSTPAATQLHHVKSLTEIRPGTYVFNDMNCVHGSFARLEDCAARILATVVSDAVADQVVIDAGSKVFTSDLCGPRPDSGHGWMGEYPSAVIKKLTEEHGQVDVSQCEQRPKVGDRVTIIPNHICPVINLQDRVWWLDDADAVPQPNNIDARGLVV